MMQHLLQSFLLCPGDQFVSSVCPIISLSCCRRGYESPSPSPSRLLLSSKRNPLTSSASDSPPLSREPGRALGIALLSRNAILSISHLTHSVCLCVSFCEASAGELVALHNALLLGSCYSDTSNRRKRLLRKMQIPVPDMMETSVTSSRRRSSGSVGTAAGTPLPPCRRRSCGSAQSVVLWEMQSAVNELANQSA